jgi:tryptophanase
MHPTEPFRIKLVEPITFLGVKERRQILKKAHYNLFKIPSEKVAIDFLTDSGTGSLSQDQLAMLVRSDEAYAFAASWRRFENSARKFSGKKEIIPVHQGRAAEKIIGEIFLKKDDIVLANNLFDTTLANFEHRGAKIFDIPVRGSSNLKSSSKFKGNIDVKKLCENLKKYGSKVKLVVLTVTNNTGGGQPVSLSNVKKAADIARKFRVPLLLDACRIAENAFFIFRDELKSRKTIAEIIRRLFSFSDLAFMSAKKDGLANSGGFIATNSFRLANKFRELGILYEGFSTYGGMSGRELEIVAQGLKEVVNESYLRHRIGQVAYFHGKLSEIGVPLINPAGGHAVYIDAGKLFSHIPSSFFPGQALAVALYEEGGIRGVEIGSLMFGDRARFNLVRLALPRRVYTQSHIDYVVRIMKKVMRKKKSIHGFKIIWQPSVLRHFSCKLKPL